MIAAFLSICYLFIHLIRVNKNIFIYCFLQKNIIHHYIMYKKEILKRDFFSLQFYLDRYFLNVQIE